MSRDLLQHLSAELWQTEQSASQHCRREADRLGDQPPARALLAAAEHADDVLATLPQLSLEQSRAGTGIGAAVGKMFSQVRDTLADKLLTRERSYRGTLLGLRHGIDLITLILDAAQLEGDRKLINFCEAWLSRRQPVVEAVAAELHWFADHPKQALEQSRGFVMKRPKMFAPSAQ